MVDVITFSMDDYKGDGASLSFYMPTGILPTDIQLFINAVGDSLSDISGGFITGVTWTQQIASWGTQFRTEPLAGVDMERGANIGFAVDGSVSRWTSRVPAFNPVYDDGEEVDLSDLAVALYLTALEDGVGTAIPSNQFAVDLGAHKVPALITFHKAIKG